MLERRQVYSVAALAIGCSLAACAPIPTMQVGDATIQKEQGEEAFSQVKTRGAFDLDCPKEKLVLVVLGVIKVIGEPDKVDQIGVSGCERKAVYVNTQPYGHKWVMNSDGGSKEK